METAFLSTFVLVADTGSMAEAARRLGVTPAAVAQQLKVLEREMGVSLLARAGRTVAPTEAGYRLLDRSRGLLRDVSGLRDWVNEDGAAKELRIGTINTALHSLLPETLARFAVDYPDVTIFFQSGMSKELYEAVQHGELDAAICIEPRFALPKSMTWGLLQEEPLVVWAPPRNAEQDPHELLRNEPFIRYDRNLLGGRQSDRYLRKQGITPRERFELSSLSAIAIMVDLGLGVSLVPDATSPGPAGANVCKLALPFATEIRRFGMVWPRASPRGKLLNALLVHAQAVVKKAAPQLNHAT